MNKTPHWIDPETGERKKKDTSHRRRRCAKCGAFHESKQNNCNDCLAKAMRLTRQTSYKPLAHKRAYTHIIRHEPTAKLYKASLLIGHDMPDDYVIIYETPPGHVLPTIYKDLEKYEE